MPFGSVRLVPGVNTERTPTLLEAGYSTSELGRFKDGLFQKIGGWTLFYPLSLAGVPRDLHAWQDLNQVTHLAVGTTTSFAVITTGSLQTLTPQQLVSNFAPNFSTTIGSPLVEIIDPNIDTLTTFDSVFFNTPVSVGGIILSGLLPIEVVTGAHSYKIRALTNATATVANGGAVPSFSTVALSETITVALANNAMALGDTIVFAIPTTQNGVTINGAYQSTAIVTTTNFQIQAGVQANATGTFTMNGGDAQLLYFIALGPSAAGSGYGLGGYGLGGYGTGAIATVQTGTPIQASDWTTDNWGEIGLACPADGTIYYWSPSGGYSTLAAVTGAPTFCSGIFVSTSQQILIAYGASIPQKIGEIQDPLWVAWSNSGDFFDWVPLSTNLAGGFHIPIGSEIRGGMAVSNQNLIWTDLDLWAMNFIGYPDTFGFNKIGAGAGSASRHAMMALRGSVYWMGTSNFFKYDGGGVSVMPCPVWDQVFQNLNLAFASNIRAMPNTPFNEAGWFYPSMASVSGECDSYVKMNITEPGAPWDYGPMARSAWIDQSVFGANPIATSPQGQVFYHESGTDAAGGILETSFTTGYFYLSEGEDFAFIDQIYPDFKFGLLGGVQSAQIQVTFNVVNYPTDVPVQYGPYTVTESTQYISTRIRGRQMSITVSSDDIGSFWRIGKLRYRYASMGRR